MTTCRTLTMMLAAAATAGFGLRPASAGRVYSVNIGTRTLVRIDTATAAITDVGPLEGFNGTIYDLEFAGSRLFAVANVSGQGVSLMEIDPATGNVISTNALELDKGPPDGATEGLGSDELGNLILSFGINSSTSDRTGVVSPTGVITDVQFYSEDLDGLARRSLGGMYGLDRSPGTSSIRLYSVARDPASASLLQMFTIDSTLNGVDEVAETARGLFALDYNSKQLHSFDRRTGALLASTPYDIARTFVNIAAPPRCPGDANDDGVVTFPDVTSILANFGADYGGLSGPGDANFDFVVSFPDVIVVLGNFGATCL